MKVYHSAQSRSVRPLWLLEELGVPYEVVNLDFGKSEQKAPEYLKIHPHGAVPALVDGDVTLIESAAICMYLADKFPEKKMAPPVGTKERALYYQWMVYSMATLEPPVLQVFLHTIRLPEEQRSESSAAEGRQRFAEVAGVLTQALKGKKYLLGDQFSAVDIMIGTTLTWAQFMGLLAGQDALQSYVARLSQRPAFQKANG